MICNIDEVKNALEVMERTLHPEDYKVLVDGVAQAVRNQRESERSQQVTDDLVEWVSLRRYSLWYLRYPK